MKARATFRLDLPSEKQLKIFFNSLEPEVRNPTTSRSRTNLEKKGKSLVLKVEAEDTVALRATLNAYLRWINSLFNVLQVLEVH